MIEYKYLMRGDKDMATSSFYTDIVIDDEKKAKRFVKTLEEATKVKSKKISVKYKSIKDKKDIQRII